MRGIKLSAIGECAECAVKFGAVGEGGQWNYAPLEKTQNEGPFFINFTKLFSECEEGNYVYSSMTQNEIKRYRRMRVEALGAFSYGA